MPKPLRRHESEDKTPAGPLRIIGGNLRGRTLVYSGDVRTRPMKERVREAAFNLLGPAVKGKHVIDLFAGTGALGLEAISRGAVRGTLIERHFPTAKLIEQNIERLQFREPCQVVGGDAFYWGPRVETDGTTPWLVFCSPPYELYHNQTQAMLQLIETMLNLAPYESTFVVETDLPFDASLLPQADAWRTREYPPARVCLLTKHDAEAVAADQSAAPNDIDPSPL